MNLNFARKWAFYQILNTRGQYFGRYYERYKREEQHGIPADTTRQSLIHLLEHARKNVPYYRDAMAGLGDGFYQDPEAYLQQMPILTKDIIRTCYDQLKSEDLPRRKWFYNTSGGSTGEPVKFIQDNEYISKSGAVKQMFSQLAGRDVGEPEVYLWGSERDILEGSENWRARAITWLTQSTFVNAFRMTPEKMREFITRVNTQRPRLIVAYAEPIYEIARFAEQEGLRVLPQSAIITSAAMLYPFMREKIEQVFQCKVYNRYGSREVGDVACERPGMEGMWVAPWANYIEILDEQGRRVPDGEEGEIVITSLINEAMPFIRFRIGDRGALMPKKDAQNRPYGQVLQSLLGRNVDVFRTASGTLVYSGYFMVLLFYKDWVTHYQVIQKGLNEIVYRIVPRGDARPTQAELDEMVHHARCAMGEDCQVRFEFVDEIPATRSGKFRYTICELDR